MITIEELSFRLSDFKHDPITVMEISSYRGGWDSERFLFDSTALEKKWTGTVDKERGKFKVCRNKSGLLRGSATAINIHGIKDQKANEVIVKLKPSFLFSIHLLFVPVFLIFIIEEIGLNPDWMITVLLLFILESIWFYRDFKESLNEIDLFMSSLINEEKNLRSN